MSTPGAIQHLVEHIKIMQPAFFDTNAENQTSSTTYNNVVLSIRNGGYSSATEQKCLRFLVRLGAYQPAGITEYNVWVNDPKLGNPKPTQAAVVSALENLVGQGMWSTKKMTSVSA